MRGRPFFQGPLPLKAASIAGRGRGAGLAASSWATARTCSGRVDGHGWAVLAGAGAPLAASPASGSDPGAWETASGAGLMPKSACTQREKVALCSGFGSKTGASRPSVGGSDGFAVASAAAAASAASRAARRAGSWKSGRSQRMVPLSLFRCERRPAG